MRGTSGRVKECKSSTDERSTTWACTVETTMLLSNAAALLKLGACETMPLPKSRCRAVASRLLEGQPPA